MSQFKKLFEPIKVGEVELKNRLVALAIGTGYVKAGRLTQRHKDFLIERAKGGAGLMITSFSPIYGGSEIRGGEALPGIYEDGFVPELRELRATLQAQGVKVAAQLIAVDKWAKDKDSPLEVVGPSDVIKGPGASKPRPLTVKEIHQIVESFGEATRRAREAGFDAVEIHAGVGLVVNQFLSPFTNRRTDEYGGSLENRLRFLLEIIDAAKKKAGSDYTLICRISADEFMEGGNILEDTKKVAPILEKAGIRCLDVAVAWHESPIPVVQMSVPRGAFVYLAEEIKKVVNIPVATAYRVNDPWLAERIVAEGKADLVGLARALIADPEFPNKAREGRPEDIRPCIACCRCLDLILEGQPLACTVNARVGKEREYSIQPAPKPKTVFVVGGGPAGMEAAGVAAQRGHKVTLWEKEDRLGGQMLFAVLPPYKGEIHNLTDYLIGQLKKSHVEIKLNQEATAQSILEGKPDVVIVATGASPIIPDIPGVKGAKVSTALEVLRGKETGQGVVVIGGGMVGCEIAEFLAEKGKKVTILEMLNRVGNDIGPTTRWVVLQRLRKAGIRMETRITATEITDEGVKGVRDGAFEFFPADTVVLAVGMKSRDGLAQQLEGKIPAVHSIGDCVEPQRIAQAMEVGLKIAREI